MLFTIITYDYVDVFYFLALAADVLWTTHLPHPFLATPFHFLPYYFHSLRAKTTHHHYNNHTIYSLCPL